MLISKMRIFKTSFEFYHQRNMKPKFAEFTETFEQTDQRRTNDGPTQHGVLKFRQVNWSHCKISLLKNWIFPNYICFKSVFFQIGFFSNLVFRIWICWNFDYSNLDLCNFGFNQNLIFKIGFFKFGLLFLQNFDIEI